MTVIASAASVRLFMMLLMVPAADAWAADAAAAGPESVARIIVSGSGEAVAPAARANLTIGVQTQGTTAAAAGADDARLSQAVAGALRSAGLPAADLKATHLAINPQWVYVDHTHQRRRTGFQAYTTLIIDTAELDKLGAWVDAALSAGATNVSDPSFVPADDTALRRLALSRAVQNARGDAEIMASAAGGTLGALLQVDQGQGIVTPMGGLQEMVVTAARRVPAASPTNLMPGDIHVTATVTAIWRYIAGPGAPGR
jgi:uncharacterized protein YggE